MSYYSLLQIYILTHSKASKHIFQDEFEKTVNKILPFFARDHVSTNFICPLTPLQIFIPSTLLIIPLMNLDKKIKAESV